MSLIFSSLVVGHHAGSALVNKVSAFHQGYCQPDQWPEDKLVRLCLVTAQCLSTNLATNQGCTPTVSGLVLCMLVATILSSTKDFTVVPELQK